MAVGKTGLTVDQTFMLLMFFIIPNNVSSAECWGVYIVLRCRVRVSVCKTEVRRPYLCNAEHHDLQNSSRKYFLLKLAHVCVRKSALTGFLCSIGIDQTRLSSNHALITPEQPCFPPFCHSAIPTSHYILNVLYYLSKIYTTNCCNELYDDIVGI